MILFFMSLWLIFSHVLLPEIVGIPFDEEVFSEIQKDSFIILYIFMQTMAY